MKRARRKPEEILQTMREVNGLLRQGARLSDAAATVGVSYSTIYHWRRRYADASMATFEVVRRLEAENARLRKALLELDGN